MIKNFTLGQYFPSGSVIHKLDPRFKLIEIILSIILVFLAPDFLGLGVLSIFLLTVMLISKVPVSMYLKNLKPLIIILIFTSLLNVFYVAEGTVVFSWWIFTITTGGIYKAIFMSLRIVLMILMSAVLTYPTTPTELTDAIESLLSP